MTYELLFWWTGLAVWIVLSGCISLALVIGFIVGTIGGFRTARTWAGIRMMRKRITDGEMEFIHDHWPRIPAKIDYDELMGWFRQIADREKAWDNIKNDASLAGKDMP